MPPLWVVLALGCLRLGSGVNLQPQLASVTFATNNPTLTTAALEKPLCTFDSSAALHGTYEVYLYVLVDSASFRNASVQDSTKTPLSSTFQQTKGGRTGPYKTAAFDLTPCSDSPSLDAVWDVSRASEILNAYLIRVGTNGTCLSDPNFQGLCNPPLSAATEYRFKYVLVNMSSGLVQDQTLWSDPIRTNWLTPYSAIDTWPGRRSGGMIVITSILGSLPFFLLVGFAGAIILSLVVLFWKMEILINIVCPVEVQEISEIVSLLYSLLGTQAVLFSRSGVSCSLRPHGLQHARPPGPSPSPGVCSNSCPLR